MNSPLLETEQTLCRGCGATAVKSLVNFGEQPPSNRFERLVEPDSIVHTLALGQCQACALIQLISPIPATLVKPRFKWLTYNEPEGHLDQLVDGLTRLEGISKTSKIRGLTYLDDSMLARFSRAGYSNTFRYHPKHDFGIHDDCAGLETIQSAINLDVAENLGRSHGYADLFIIRYALEHAHAPAHLIQRLASLVKPGGYLVFEVPDCTKFIGACDYSFVWEEHVCYFSPLTLSSFATRHGFAIRDLMGYPQPLEDSLAIVLKVGSDASEKWPETSNVEGELEAGQQYARNFKSAYARIRNYLGQLREQGKHIAMFGASHLAVKFINFFKLNDIIECVLDDNPHKQGMLMPGSRIPIVSSSILAEGKVDLCLLSLSPESEKKVLAKQQAYVARGGSFASIFMLSPISLCG